MLSALDVKFLGQPGMIAAGLIDGGGSGVALVDPGPTTSLAGLRAALASRGRDLADVEDILLTHIHLDHAGGTGAIVREHPRVRVHVHERGAPHMIDPSHLMRSAARLYGADLERLWGEMVPVPDANVRVLSGGETIRAAGRDIRTAYTPGHASHHVSYFEPGTRTALVGDTGGVRVGAWPVVLPPTPPPDVDLDAWSESLDKVRAWAPEAVFLTHFGAFGDAGAHLDELRRWIGEVRSVAESVLSDDALNADERGRAFAARLEERIAAHAGADAAAACARAMSFANSWLGLERYLGRRR